MALNILHTLLPEYGDNSGRLDKGYDHIDAGSGHTGHNFLELFFSLRRPFLSGFVLTGIGKLFNNHAIHFNEVSLNPFQGFKRVDSEAEVADTNLSLGLSSFPHRAQRPDSGSAPHRSRGIGK